MKKFFSLSFAMLLGVWVFGQTTILTQDFESGSLPAGWTKTQSNPSVGWEFGNNLGSTYFPIPAHTKYAASNDDAHDDNTTTANVADQDRLITPVMDFTPYASSGVVVKFSYIQPGAWGSTGSVEVTTNGGSTWTPVSTVATTAAWAEATVNLSAYTNSSTVQVCFRHNDGGNWGDGMGVDDVTVKSVAQYDGTIVSVDVNDFVAAGNTTVSATFGNDGYANITSLAAQYTVNGGAPVTQTFNGLNVALGATGTISFTTPAALTAGTTATICVTINQVNANTDAVPGNNSGCHDAAVLSAIPPKFAILEDHTGAWCQFCPDGAVIAEQVDADYPNAIAVAVHNGDAMTIADGGTLQSQYISGYPGGMIDHFKFESESAVELNRGSWDGLMNERLGMIVPVGVSLSGISYNDVTREITVTVNAEFKGALSGDLRFNCYVVEDSVTGTGTGYNQVNYYNTVSGHPYYGAGNPIVGFIHRHTVRAMLGGAWGTNAVIPASVNDGDTYSKTYTYTLPAGYNSDRIHLIGMVQRFNAGDDTDRQIYNAAEGTLSTTTAITDPNIGQVHGVYPNPFSDRTAIEFELVNSGNYSVEVFDIFGKRVSVLANGFLAGGVHTYYWNGTIDNGAAAADGVYMVVIKGDGASFSEKIVLTR